MVQGGRGDDVFVSGGNTNTFVAAGEGDDLLIGGTASDALSGEDGEDVIDGGGGNDLLRGHRGRDQLLGGAGDDVIDGGQDDDRIDGGSGGDVLTGGAGDDNIDGDEGSDVVTYSGNYGDYRIKRSDDGVWITDTRGQDGSDFLTNVERATFNDLSHIDLNTVRPMPVNDIIDVGGRSAPIVISKTQLLRNDIDFQGDSLTLTGVSGAVGGSVALNTSGDVVFTPNSSFAGVMSFKYTGLNRGRPPISPQFSN